MEDRCITVKLKDGSIKQVKEWFEALNKRSDDVLESMRQENILVESVFLEKRNKDYYLIYIIKSPDIKKALEIFENSSLPIDTFYKKNWKQHCESITVLDELLNLDIINEYN